ncbi:MAG: shikimate kinase [Bacillota bacterium]|nr:shikimate kinase [Bacillota bacterium]
MKHSLITVTGYFGAPTIQVAKAIAAEKSLPLVVLDEEIVKRDGRSIKRLVMMNGEHGYRNLEYEVLKDMVSEGEPVVLACGDGVLYDEDSRRIITEGELHIVGRDMDPDQLWNMAKDKTDSYHAFMSFGNEDEKRKAFNKLIERQRVLFETCQTGD